MGFCGTLEHNRGAGFLTLALHCIALYDPLLRFEDSKFELKKEGQLELFSLTVKQREDYAKFVKTLSYFLDTYRREEIKTKSKRDNPLSYSEETQGLDYCDYEFYDFWYAFIRSFKDDFEFEKQVNTLDQIAHGEPLKTYEPSIQFLSTLNSRALSRHSHSSFHRRRCF